jgi:hypothetical protein
MEQIPDVVLTPEEHQECLDFIRMVTRTADRELYVRPDLVEPTRRHLMASAMMGRAERFSMLAREQAEYREKAVEAAAKASAIYPTSVYVFDFAKILDQCGRPDEAQTMYAEFLRRHELGPLSEIDESIMAQRDIEGMIAYASERVHGT